MQDLGRILGRFVTRDIIYILSGSLVLLSILIVIPVNSTLYQTVSDKLNRSNDVAIVLAISAFICYLIAYILQESFAVLGISTISLYFIPKNGAIIGRVVSIIHRRTHGFPLILDREVQDSANPSLLFEVDGPATFTMNMEYVNDVLALIQKLSSEGSSAEIFAFAQFAREPLRFQTHPTMDRLIFLRHMSSIGGPCLAVSGLIFVGAFALLGAEYIWSFLWIGLVCALMGLFLCIHSFYRAAQVFVARMVINEAEVTRAVPEEMSRT